MVRSSTTSLVVMMGKCCYGWFEVDVKKSVQEMLWKVDYALWDTPNNHR